MKIERSEKVLPSVVPLYAQIRDRLVERIASAEWAVGETIPNEFQLASHYGVSVGTIRRAVIELDDRGVVRRVQGRGTFVAGRDDNDLVERFERFRQPNGDPLHPTIELVSLNHVQADAEVARSLGVTVGADILQISQKLLSKQSVVGLWCSHLPAARLTSLHHQLRCGQHLYPLLAEFGVLIARTEDATTVEMADERTREILQLPTPRMVMVERRIAFDLGGSPVEYRVASYVPGMVQIQHTSG